jgi:hypothetical protein
MTVMVPGATSVTRTLVGDSAAAQATVSAVAEAFLAIADIDGLLSAEEFTRAVIEFWSSTDPNAPFCGASPVVAEVSSPGRPVGLSMSTDQVGVRHDGGAHDRKHPVLTARSADRG